ncbi:MAG: hypothetical protein HC926_05335 [Synechococcaceae cyanobacterium SM2_3_60]|nr:hypothetical protein [Synechococcaceae cyanobacterium SM2_3_60]
MTLSPAGAVIETEHFGGPRVKLAVELVAALLLQAVQMEGHHARIAAEQQRRATGHDV